MVTDLTPRCPQLQHLTEIHVRRQNGMIWEGSGRASKARQGWMIFRSWQIVFTYTRSRCVATRMIFR